jgi:hypothetical protein
VHRLDARLDGTAAAAGRAQTIGGAGVLAAVVGIVIGLAAGRRRTGASGGS